MRSSPKSGPIHLLINLQKLIINTPQAIPKFFILITTMADIDWHKFFYIWDFFTFGQLNFEEILRDWLLNELTRPHNANLVFDCLDGSNSCPGQPKIDRYMCSISSSQTNREAIIPSPRPPPHTQGWFILNVEKLVRGKFQRHGFHLVTLRRCNTAAVYRSIWDSAHRLKTTTATIIEALMARAENYLHNDPLFINTCLN